MAVKFVTGIWINRMPLKYFGGAHVPVMLVCTHARWFCEFNTFSPYGVLVLMPYILDTNECEDGNNGGCTHYCYSSNRGIECYCAIGYELDVDGFTCIWR